MQHVKKIFARMTVFILLVSVLAAIPGITKADAYNHPSGLWQYLGDWDTAVENRDYVTVKDLANKMYALYNGESLNADNCAILSSISSKAADAYRETGDYDNAISWLKRQRIYDEWLYYNYDSGYSSSLTLIDALIKQLSVDVEIYTTAYAPADVPYYGVLGEQEVGTLQGSVSEGTSTLSESATLVYVEFEPNGAESMQYWIQYYLNSSEKNNNTASGNGVMELAWNFPFEGDSAELKKIANGTYDTYIRESARTIAAQNCKVLLRIGAEMNNWDINAGEFIAAYRHIVTLVREETRNSNNVAFVFSVCGVGKWGTTYMDFYPGDAYVDWIGLSAYSDEHESSGRANTDAFYGFGEYSQNPLYFVKLLTEAFPNKPIMISECGFSYIYGSKDTTSFAVDRMNKFYSYVNMVFPQVKAVLYFDNKVGDQTNYLLSGNAAIRNTYSSLVTGDTYLSSLDDTAKGYTRLATMQEVTDTLELYTYAIFPSNNTTTCTYYLDGNQVLTTSRIPYKYSVNVSSLSMGMHTVVAEVTCGNMTKAVTRQFYVGADSMVAGQDNLATGKFSDVNVNEWYYNLVCRAADYGLMNGDSTTTFAPSGSITRAEFVTVLRNMAAQMGYDVSSTSHNNFSDVDYSQWYGQFINWAYETGVASGYEDRTFKPEAPVTREEMASLLVNFSKYLEIDLDTSGSYSGYSDSGSIGQWARGYVETVTRAGIMEGSSGKFEPQSNTSRAEAATVAVKFYERYYLAGLGA